MSVFEVEHNDPTVRYKIGEEFLMTIFLPPELQAVHNTPSMIVKAVYRGMKSREEVLSEGLKVIALLPESNEHHIVEYAGDLWVNDMITLKGTLLPKNWRKVMADLTKKEPIVPVEKAPVVEEAVEIPKQITPREKLSWMIPGTHRRNIEGLLANHRETDSPIYRCAVSNEELYYIRDDGTTINLRTRAVCCECGKLVGEDNIHNSGADRSSHPVVYSGAHCTECWPNKK